MNKPQVGETWRVYLGGPNPTPYRVKIINEGSDDHFWCVDLDFLPEDHEPFELHLSVFEKGYWLSDE